MPSKKSKPSLPLERIHVRVLREIPVFEELRPEVGKVYEAVRGYGPRGSRGDIVRLPFCVIECGGKQIVLRASRRIGSTTMQPEYEEVAL